MTSESENYCEEPIVEPSKHRLSYNKAFLTLSGVELDGTVSTSLDELDQCIISKADLALGLLHYENIEDDDTIKVTFSQSIPTIHSISTISEVSESETISSCSPMLDDNYNDSGSLERAIHDLSSSCGSDSETEMLPSPEFFSLNDREPIISQVSQLGEHPDKENLSPFIRQSDISHPLSLKSNSKTIMNLSNCSVQESTVPKSILKKRPQRRAGLSSEPSLSYRRHTLGDPHFVRNIKSVSNSETWLLRNQTPGSKVPRISLPARLSISKLQLTLKINSTLQRSLRQVISERKNEELVRLLVEQANRINEDIKRAVIRNTLKYGGISFLVLITAVTVGMCIRNKLRSQ